MENKYHISKSGTPAICTAKEQCRLGIATSHFDSPEAAQDYSDYLNEEIETLKSHFSENSSDDEVRKYIELRDTHKKLLSEYYEDAEKLKQEDNSTDEWHKKVDENRRKFYKAKRMEYAYRELQPESLKEKPKEEKKQRYWGRGSSYNPHPDYNDKTKNDYLTVVSSYTGLSHEEIQSQMNNYKQNELSDTEAIREVFKNTPLRMDKPIVAIDLETNALPLEEMNGEFDRGPRSEIIEVGYCKIYPDGRVEEKSALYGVSEDLYEINGSGAVDVHNITPEDIKEKERFIGHSKDQEQLINDLKGSVMLAHNAQFEINQLGHSLKGFNKLLKDNEIEVLDTMNVSKYFMPENERNTNEVFVQNTGGKYENAHRALSDAKMSYNALMRLKGENKRVID